MSSPPPAGTKKKPKKQVISREFQTKTEVENGKTVSKEVETVRYSDGSVQVVTHG